MITFDWLELRLFMKSDVLVSALKSVAKAGAVYIQNQVEANLVPT